MGEEGGSENKLMGMEIGMKSVKGREKAQLGMGSRGNELREIRMRNGGKKCEDRSSAREGESETCVDRV